MASENQGVKGWDFYIDLDCILDTRLGLLNRLSPTTAETVLADGSYFKRLYDGWPDVSLQDFRKAYALRDVDVLPDSFLTEILHEIDKQIKAIRLKVAVESGIKHPRIVVNVNPYVLDQATQDDIGLCVLHHTGALSEVEVVSWTTADLTPAACRDRFVRMYMYDRYDDWLEMHIAKILKLGSTRLTDLTIVGPEVIFRDDIEPPTHAAFQQQNTSGLNPFRAVEQAAKSFIGLELLPVNYFSIINLER